MGRDHRLTAPTLALLLACCLGFGLPSRLLAGQAQTGSIAGTVVDTSGGHLPGVIVTLKGPSILREQTFTTDQTGEFHFPSVPPGTYTVSAELQGFTTIARTGVAVNVGGAARADFVMEIASVNETVTVSGVTTVDVDTNRVATTLSAVTLQSVPYQRDFYDVLKATPGVTNDNQSYRGTTSINGAGVRNTAYAVDGTNLTDAAASYAGIRNLSYDSFDEMEIVTGAMPAEVGSASGGYVNIVTKSGGNEFHGGGSFFYSNDSLQSGLQDSIIAQGVRPNSTGIHRLLDAAIETGGPIARGKAWFYGNYRRLNNDTVGIGFRYEPLALPETNDTVFGKATIQPSNDHKLIFVGSYFNRYQPQFTYTVSPFVDRLGNWYFKEKGPTLSAQWQWTLNQKTFLETRFGSLLKQTWYEIQPESHAPSTFNLSTNETTNAQPRGQHDWRDRYQVNASLSHYEDALAGTHQFKLGLDYSFFSHLQSEDSLFGYQEQYTGTQPTYVQFANGFPDRIARYKHLTDWGIYGQDRWTVGKRLTMNLGIRVAGVRFTFPAQNFGPTGVFPDLQSIPLFQPVSIPEVSLAKWTDVSPRIGVTFDLTGDGKTPLKASYSRYDDQVFTYLADGPMAWRTALSRWSDLNGDGLVQPGEYGAPISVSGIANPPDPNAKRPYWNEYLLGIERELLPRFSVGTRLTYRKNYNIFDDVDVGTAGGYFPVTIFDPGPDGVRGTADDVGPMTAYDLVPSLLGKQKTVSENVPGASRIYKAVEFSGTKRMADGWQLFASALISRSEGNLNNGYGGTAGVTNNYNNPNFRINEYGLLDLDSTYQIKLGGTYSLPYGIDVGALYLHLTGNPYTRQIRVSTDINGKALNLGNITVNAEPLGSERLPSQDTLNLNGVKKVALGNGRELKLMVDVFNLTNQNTPLGVSSLSGKTFGGITTILPPRFVRLGARLTF